MSCPDFIAAAEAAGIYYTSCDITCSNWATQSCWQLIAVCWCVYLQATWLETLMSCRRRTISSNCPGLQDKSPSGSNTSPTTADTWLISRALDIDCQVLSIKESMARLAVDNCQRPPRPPGMQLFATHVVCDNPCCVYTTSCRWLALMPVVWRYGDHHQRIESLVQGCNGAMIYNGNDDHAGTINKNRNFRP